jgi:hypothetical protein
LFAWAPEEDAILSGLRRQASLGFSRQGSRSFWQWAERRAETAPGMFDRRSSSAEAGEELAAVVS